MVLANQVEGTHGLASSIQGYDHMGAIIDDFGTQVYLAGETKKAWSNLSVERVFFPHEKRVEEFDALFFLSFS